MSRPPLPPFTRETAAQKARMAEDAWNSRDPERVALAYTEDSRWRNRSEFFQGRAAIVAFLTRKWARELDYRLIKDLWAFDQNHIAVRFQYEWRDDAGQWHRSYGNEQWEFDENGLMRRREASINDIAIAEKDRRFHWPAPRSAAGGCAGTGREPVLMGCRPKESLRLPHPRALSVSIESKRGSRFLF
jgi:nuclear transport factor 2 (NTF2) superfamily protein